MLTTANESKKSVNSKMYAKWLALHPDEPNRTEKSVVARWAEMNTKFRSFFLSLFTAKLLDSSWLLIKSK